MLIEEVIQKWNGTETANIASRNLVQFKKELARAKK